MLSRDLERHVESMRREVRWLRFGVVVLALIVAGGLLVAARRGPDDKPVDKPADTPADKIVKATRFVVEDAKGRTRAVFGMRADGLPGITLRDEKGAVTRGIILVNSAAEGFTWRPERIETKRLAITDGEGRARIVLETTDDEKGAPAITLVDDLGKERARCSLRMDGLPLLKLTARVDALLALVTKTFRGELFGVLAQRGPVGSWYRMQFYDDAGNILWGFGKRE